MCIRDSLQADLADSRSWDALGKSFRRELEGFDGERVVFVQAAGTIDPLGFAGEVDPSEYRQNVLLNAAAPLVLGQLFLAAAEEEGPDRHLVMITSGAARSVYPGWSSYGAAKAGVDQWVRDAGAEQAIRGGVKVVAVAPGTVDTGMQTRLRDTTEDQFPNRQKFLDLHREGKLSDVDDVARQIWGLLERDLENGSVVDLRELAKNSG